MKLWLDDIRRPPDDSWEWARTVDEAVDLVELYWKEITVMSLDHDLGLHLEDPDQPGAIFLRGGGAITGLDFVRYICRECGISSCEFVVHSWNPIGAQRMVTELRDAGYRAYMIPFDFNAHSRARSQQ